ncbi:MAG: DUF1566 domain-containing protein [Legionellaceae bacterium]|nr:DUF1566 domain-containing protein [Legionellaceae bacterium]
MMTRVTFKSRALLITLTALGLLPTLSFSASRAITTQDLFTKISATEPWYKGILTATKTVSFQQSASGGTDATTVSKVQLGYFTSADCTGALAGDGFYNTPNGTSFTISVGTPFGLVAASSWNVGETQLNIADMTTINSVAITLKSTNNDVPQSNFSTNSFACVAVTCAANACTSAAGTQSFELKTTAAVGDPADGGVIVDTDGLIATALDDSTGIQWGGTGTTIGASAQSDTDGAANTTAIVTALGEENYAAQLCNALSITGGYTSDWFLPAREQLSALYDNKETIGNFANDNYWSSTEFPGNPSLNAWVQSFDSGFQFNSDKDNSSRVRCVRAFTP